MMLLKSVKDSTVIIFNFCSSVYLFSENKHRYEYIKINFGYREKVKHAVRMRYIWFFLKVVLLGVVLISCHCELKA